MAAHLLHTVKKADYLPASSPMWYSGDTHTHTDRQRIEGRLVWEEKGALAERWAGRERECLLCPEYMLYLNGKNEKPITLYSEYPLICCIWCVPMWVCVGACKPMC